MRPSDTEIGVHSLADTFRAASGASGDGKEFALALLSALQVLVESGITPSQPGGEMRLYWAM